MSKKKRKGIKDENNRIRLDPKGNEETLRRHWQENFKIQPEDNIKCDEENEQIVNQHNRRHNRIQQTRLRNLPNSPSDS